MVGDLEVVFDYHEATKHGFKRYARGPGHLDWATQPDPFRRYHGAPLIPLDPSPAEIQDPLYDHALTWGRIPAAPLNSRSVSWLLRHSLALSAWKQAGGTAWALRVNPSSGNLHPTEGYLVTGPVHGLSDEPGVYHYAPREHGLERRAVLPAEIWKGMTAGLPPGSLLMGISSIHWRESWKYGERAYRYCQLDVGHALAAIGLAASGLGWKARLLDGPGTEAVGALLGLPHPSGPEAEHADGLILIQTRQTDEDAIPKLEIPDGAVLESLAWQGRPNELSPDHAKWEIIEAVARASRKPATPSAMESLPWSQEEPGPDVRPGLLLSHLALQRRSAVSMDGATRMPASAFFRMLRRAVPTRRQGPHAVLPWSPQAHLALFVHRVDGLSPGLYMLPSTAEALPDLREAMRGDFLWNRPPECPQELLLFQLLEGDLRQAAAQISCFQDIAGAGCFSTGMIAEFEGPLQDRGPWFYPRLFWECGLIGQMLYLEAEAAGLRATGIGCYFDDPMHHLLGLKSRRYQDLYHLTVGGPIEDDRLTTLPAYPG